MTNTPYKTTFKQLADMKAKIGEEIGLSEWIKIDQATINSFAKLTRDEQWIHVDPERAAKESPYKTPIAHGFLVLSFASDFSFQCLGFENVAMGVNYGFDKIRFINATPVDARIRGRIALLAYEQKENAAKYKLGLTIEIEGQEKPACVAEWIAMAYEKR